MKSRSREAKSPPAVVVANPTSDAALAHWAELDAERHAAVTHLNKARAAAKAALVADCNCRTALDKDCKAVGCSAARIRRANRMESVLQSLVEVVASPPEEPRP